MILVTQPVLHCCNHWCTSMYFGLEAFDYLFYINLCDFMTLYMFITTKRDTQYNKSKAFVLQLVKQWIVLKAHSGSQLHWNEWSQQWNYTGLTETMALKRCVTIQAPCCTAVSPCIRFATVWPKYINIKELQWWKHSCFD